jgi:predicted GIY-YIG superfamily endonuclease
VRSTKAGSIPAILPMLRASTRQASMGFYYVYVLQSEADPRRFYTGLTHDLKARIAKHNRGEVPHSAKFRPWRIKTAVAFTDRERAIGFERYLKTASGRAFMKKRL